ncbi:MAG: ECF transporter S component [Clostridia bacterium]|nr:ECF transporter S component [Clostridia bacterium]
MRTKGVDRLVKLGLLAALSCLMMLIRFPWFTAAFLEYDMADVPILIGTFLYGPWWGLLLTAAVCILQGVTVSAGSGIIGVCMHFFATGGFVLVAGLIYRRLHTFRGALISLACGAVTMILLMIPLNLVFTGYFMGAPMETVIAMLLPVIIPFNAFKAGLNALITLLLYKAIGRVLKKEFIHAPLPAKTKE